MPKESVCNFCGKELDIWDEQEDFTINKTLGYGTIYDGNNLHIRLCCSCAEKIINDCKISPISVISEGVISNQDK